ncbi:XTP/dITP diphosphatase [Salinicoccus siamensis]|uniref:dITP/XTP pyrophosphatase n=1 Tax=Salinicoccus siamensis TaxID=381830 RepID=A0ABV5Z2P7_9STAP
MKIVIATGNKGKIRDFKTIFSDVEVIGIKELLPDFEVEETEDTFEGNAVLKAESASKALGLPVISDDSGLCVDALDGAPGVYSARYAGLGASDEDNNRKLLAALTDVENRSARFVCVIALAIPGRDTRSYVGQLHGEILESSAGEGGFGYDPLFKTLQGEHLGMISTEQKGEISHRRKALEKLKHDASAFEILLNHDGGADK